ncbi:LPS export ABC transporter periplasmic protein LptC [Oceanospirillum linum]|uniref:Lipopolysaccharide export system protein LptC n=2 Tax=Oceanospirillum TaxID=965 RepID=A0A1T1H9D9_OCELI|nr:LPS export ABC transporter periplasmic protein LptC [Oceanospirillum linum]OOV86484.1 LPS export ABC transporter periplasmic protein LptC [Oceanospirillum linum]SEG34746.1 Lipopolysaccharide-assembly, LptC-related [Oleiphilus messinensis]SMP29549.1 LPS export ABC transporter protein LptC [Oceanospirillum linum]
MLFGKRLKKRFISLIGLMALGVAVHFLDVQRPQSFDLFSDLPDAPSEPDYYTVNSTFLEYNADGVLSRSLRSERLLHYPDIEETALVNPEIISYGSTGMPQWQAMANSGLVEGDGSHFQLNQNVIVWQISAENLSDATIEAPVDMQLSTEQLNIDMDKNQVTTDKAIKIITQEGMTSAIGLFADLTTNQITLKNQVKSLYQKQSLPLIQRTNVPESQQDK